VEINDLVKVAVAFREMVCGGLLVVVVWLLTRARDGS